MVELLESVKAWETKGHSNSTSMSHLRTALQLVMTLTSENGNEPKEKGGKGKEEDENIRRR